MALKQAIQEDVKVSLKSSDQITSGVLRMTLAAIVAKEKEKRYKISKDNPSVNEEELLEQATLSDEQILEVLSAEIKKRKDAITLYEQGGRKDLAEKERGEISILQKYLPTPLSPEELAKLVAESVQSVGAKEMKDMGRVMADLNPKIKGKADNSEVSKMVKELLSK